MRALKIISDPKAFQLIGDETRRRMIYLLRAKDYTVSQIAAELDKTPQAIYHHIAKMKEAGLIEVAREERVDHFIETYYQATAEVFQFSHGKGDAKVSAKEAEEALKALPRLVPVKLDKKTIDKLVSTELQMDSVGARPDIEAKITDLEDVGFIARQSLGFLVRVSSMTDEECDEYIGLLRDFRETLKAARAAKADA